MKAIGICCTGKGVIGLFLQYYRKYLSVQSSQHVAVKLLAGVSRKHAVKA